VSRLLLLSLFFDLFVLVLELPEPVMLLDVLKEVFPFGLSLFEDFDRKRVTFLALPPFVLYRLILIIPLVTGVRKFETWSLAELEIVPLFIFLAISHEEVDVERC